jgi:hypothetical protein
MAKDAIGLGLKDRLAKFDLRFAYFGYRFSRLSV